MTERWKPEDREKFWFIDRDGNANFHMRTEWDSDNDKYDFGNCFQSKEEAEAAAEKVKALLLSLHEPKVVTPEPWQIWRNKFTCQNYRVLFTTNWATPEPYVTIGKMVKRLLDKPEELQIEGRRFLMDFELVQDPEEEYLHKNPENLGTSSEPSQKVGTCQKTPISESLQQEDCKKRAFVRPSHTTPDHYKLTPEPIDVIKGWDLGFCLGNVIKYIARAGHKAGESRDKDLHKAMEYLRMELEDE
ncbi:MAG: DUF3310 domain-containing protein [Candidatus Bathyarchaeota archaeon]|nr:DUF3310 domain-containing protein [Candidatus Bathyarchaeota archaeon]